MRVLKMKPENLEEIVRETMRSLKQSGVLVCPTDTVYGLICDATSSKAVRKLFRIKKRPKGKPISIFVKNIKLAKKFAFVNKNQESLLKKVWPGAMTAILKPKKNLPKNISQGKKTIGLRIPDYKLIITLIDKICHPLAESSANISGKPASTKIKEVLNQFRNKKYQPDLVLDAGNLPFQLPSTVIDLTKKRPQILRRGSGKIPLTK